MKITDEMVQAALDEAGSGWASHLWGDARTDLMRDAIRAALTAAPASAAEPVTVFYQSYDGELFASKEAAQAYCNGRSYALGGMGWKEKKLSTFTIDT